MESVERFLQQHGLPSQPPREFVELGDEPEPQVGRGLSAAPAVTPDLAALAHDAEGWLPLSVPSLEREGYQLFRAKCCVSVLLVHSETEPLERVGPVDDRSLVYGADVIIDTARFEADELIAAVPHSRSGGLLVSRHRVGRLPRELPAAPPTAAPPAVPSPARQRASEIDDKWVQDMVESLCAPGGVYAEAAAMGLLARYRPPPAEKAARGALVARLLAGEPLPSLDQERVWVRALTEAERDAIDREASAHASGLHVDLDEVLQSPDPASEAWSAAYRRLLQQRDVLEGVRVLLVAAGSATRLQAALRYLDPAGRIAVRALPRCPRIADDPHLARASIGSPDGWWTWPAHEETF